MLGSILRCGVLALALALAACGGGESEEDRVRGAVERLHADLRDGDLRAVCAAMTDRPKRQIGTVGHGRQPTTCERDLRELVASTREPDSFTGEDAPGLGEGRPPRVVDVALAPGGRRATVTATLAGDPFDIAMALEDGEWKLDDFFGAAAPPPRALR